MQSNTIISLIDLCKKEPDEKSKQAIIQWVDDFAKRKEIKEIHTQESQILDLCRLVMIEKSPLAIIAINRLIQIDWTADKYFSFSIIKVIVNSISPDKTHPPQWQFIFNHLVHSILNSLLRHTIENLSDIVVLGKHRISVIEKASKLLSYKNLNQIQYLSTQLDFFSAQTKSNISDIQKLARCETPKAFWFLTVHHLKRFDASQKDQRKISSLFLCFLILVKKPLAKEIILDNGVLQVETHVFSYFSKKFSTKNYITVSAQNICDKLKANDAKLIDKITNDANIFALALEFIAAEKDPNSSKKEFCNAIKDALGQDKLWEEKSVYKTEPKDAPVISSSKELQTAYTHLEKNELKSAIETFRDAYFDPIFMNAYFSPDVVIKPQVIAALESITLREPTDNKDSKNLNDFSADPIDIESAHIALIAIHYPDTNTCYKHLQKLKWDTANQNTDKNHFITGLKYFFFSRLPDQEIQRLNPCYDIVQGRTQHLAQSKIPEAKLILLSQFSKETYVDKITVYRALQKLQAKLPSSDFLNSPDYQKLAELLNSSNLVAFTLLANLIDKTTNNRVLLLHLYHYQAHLYFLMKDSNPQFLEHGLLAYLNAFKLGGGEHPFPTLPFKLAHVGKLILKPGNLLNTFIDILIACYKLKKLSNNMQLFEYGLKSILDLLENDEINLKKIFDCLLESFKNSETSEEEKTRIENYVISFYKTCSDKPLIKQYAIQCHLFIFFSRPLDVSESNTQFIDKFTLFCICDKNAIGMINIALYKFKADKAHECIEAFTLAMKFAIEKKEDETVKAIIEKSAILKTLFNEGRKDILALAEKPKTLDSKQIPRASDLATAAFKSIESKQPEAALSHFENLLNSLKSGNNIFNAVGIQIIIESLTEIEKTNPTKVAGLIKEFSVFKLIPKAPTLETPNQTRSNAI